MDEAVFLIKVKEVIECDTVRISSPIGRHFLIIGFKRNTIEDGGEWTNGNGEKIPHWDYTDEKVVASGSTYEELFDSAKEYARLCKMTMFDYLTENMK